MRISICSAHALRAVHPQCITVVFQVPHSGRRPGDQHAGLRRAMLDLTLELALLCRREAEFTHAARQAVDQSGGGHLQLLGFVLLTLLALTARLRAQTTAVFRTRVY